MPESGTRVNPAYPTSASYDEVSGIYGECHQIPDNHLAGRG
jgi:hypothetical protein